MQVMPLHTPPPDAALPPKISQVLARLREECERLRAVAAQVASGKLRRRRSDQKSEDYSGAPR